MTGPATRAALQAALAAALATGTSPAATHFVVVEGLGGTQAFSERFRDQLESMLPVLRRTAGADARVVVLAGTDATAERIGETFDDLASAVTPGDALAVFLIGHGTHDGDDYKFNVPGPDITAKRLAHWLDAVPTTRQLVVSTTSSSGGALETLRSPRRIVITATKNGRERTATVFGAYWAEAFSATAADVDKNETISALEAFRYAEDKVKSYYADEKRLATEHPVLQGERAESFLLARLGSAADLAADPTKQGLLARRETLERRIADLGHLKDEMSPEAYLDALQALLLEMAEIQEQISPETADEEQP